MRKKFIIVGIIFGIVSGLLAMCKNEISLKRQSTGEFSSYADYDYYGCPNSKRIKRLNTRKVKS